MRSKGKFSLVRTLALIVGAGALSSSLAVAQAARGAFKLPAETHWGKITLPAGDYSYSLDAASPTAIVTIRSAANKWSAMVLASSVSDLPPAGTDELVLTKNGEEMFVTALCVKDLGIVLNYGVPRMKEAPSLARSRAAGETVIASGSSR
jgi:hypothetical protein